MKKLALFLAFILLFGLFCGCARRGGKDSVTLNVLNWGDYIDEDLLKQFEAETGIYVNYTTMATNEEMLVKLQQPDCIYDICFPSDYIIEKLVADDLLYALNKDNIPNMQHIDGRFLDLSFDPGNEYSVPYMWGTVGILYNTTLVDDPVDSWDILWNEKYSGQILMYDSIRDTMGVALLKLGHSINTREQSDILDAEAALIEQKPLVLAYLGDPIKDRMIAGGGALAIVYSGDAMWCIDENPDLAYAVPATGTNLWFDNIIIPKTSQHTAEAEAFINFLCNPEVAAQNAEYIGYSTPNSAALEIMGEDYIDNPTYNPSQELLDKCDIFHDLGNFINVYNDSWNRVKSFVG
ncbi:MAG: spermidine/putrescine ABC transporter substrate-binding protein [Christensenellaceae bacterium]|jgi:spermidine/putrescine-binding protein|nr:spermidine/putrescine ABC transporter substrate-binding protein [Christensenellaceae bacterium]